MRKAKLTVHSLERVHRQAVADLINQAAAVCHGIGATGAVILLTNDDGKTITKSAGRLSKEPAMMAELFRIAVRTANN